jgi:CheY-like chemotaxis protein
MFHDLPYLYNRVDPMPKKVLVAEDHDDIRDMMVVFIEELGFEAIAASDGQEAVELAVQHSPDLVLMDLAMPVMDGIEAAVAIRSNPQLRNTKIIATTAYGKHIPDHVEGSEFDRIVDKPVDLDLLQPLLNEFV